MRTQQSRTLWERAARLLAALFVGLAVVAYTAATALAGNGSAAANYGMGSGPASGGGGGGTGGGGAFFSGTMEGGSSNTSPYSNAPNFAGQDNLTVTVGGVPYTGTANEYFLDGSQNGGTVSAVSANTPAGQALVNAGFPVVDGQVEISPLEVNVPGNATVSYNGGEVVNLGGSGTVTVGVSGAGADGPCCNEGPQTPWSVSLAASASDVAAGSAVTLTATADQNVAGSPYYINLVDQGSGAVEASCGSGSTCTASVSEAAATTQTFYADVGAYQAGSGAARSSTLSVTWYAITITATFTPGTAQQGQSATLQATTSGPVQSVTATLPWNGHAVALSSGGSSWSASIPTSGVAVGTYQVSVVAIGTYGGNASTTANLTVVYHPPQVGALSIQCPTVQGQTPGTAYFGEICTIAAPTSGGPVSAATATFQWTNVDVYGDVPQAPQSVDLSCGGGQCTGTWQVAAYPYTEDAPIAQDERDVPVSVSVTVSGSGGDASVGATLVVDGTIYYPVPVPGTSP